MKKPPISFYITRYIGDKLFKSMVNLNIDGKQNIPDNRQYIVISNHLNWSDPFFIYTVLPAVPRVIFVAEHNGIYDNYLKQLFIDLMGKPIIVIRREDPKSRYRALKSMFKVVKNGEILAIFPEGRLGHQEGEIFPFHVGVFSVAKRMNVPILPMAIAGSKELSLRKPIHIKIGELKYCRDDETNEDFARRMALTVKNLIPDYPGDGPYPYRCNWMTNLCQGDLRPFEGERNLIIPTEKEKRNNNKDKMG